MAGKAPKPGDTCALFHRGRYDSLLVPALKCFHACYLPSEALIMPNVDVDANANADANADANFKQD